MNKFKFYFVVFFTLLALFSCHHADDPVYVFIHDYGVQKDADSAIITDYLSSHYINPDQDPDAEIIIDSMAIAEHNTTQRIIDSPLLTSVDVVYYGVTHTIYYLKIREGVGTSPERVDQVLTAYSGSYLSRDGDKVKSTFFESQPFPQAFIGLDQVIPGWPEIFPKFKTGIFQPADGSNPASFTDYGVGVMFLPSAFGYYNVATSTIPSYSPLVFTLRLYDLRRADQDGDGIASVNEDLNMNHIFTDDDTDGDGTPDYLDRDDDGDGFLTITETKKPQGYNVPGNENYSGDNSHYPFAPTPDNPLTPEVNESETKGVPDCSGDSDNPNRVRKYLDPTCH